MGHDKTRATSLRTACTASVLAVLAYLLSVAPSVGAATVAGSLDGSLSVDRSGTATYSIPIEVPPAAGGLQPALSFNFSSRQNNGLLGVGWSLGGLSRIHRCPRLRADFGHVRGIHLDSGDDYCLDGERLVPVSGSNGADGTEYRTHIDRHARVTSHGDLAGTGPAWWRVWTRDGRTLDFGATPDSQAQAQGKAAVRTYALNRAADRYGNEMTLQYVDNAANGDHRIQRIEYSSNPSMGIAAQASVDFSYEVRPDVRRGFLRGSIVDVTHRLTTVTTRVRGDVARKYRVRYRSGTPTGPADALSRIETIEVCDPSGNCKAPVRFDVSAGGEGFSSPIHTQMDSYNYSGSVPLVGDVDGDGRADAIAVTLSSTGFYAHTSLAEVDGSYSTINYNVLFSGANFSGAVAELGDVDGDGNTDLVAMYAGSVFGAWVALGNGDGTFQSAQNRVLSSGFDFSSYRPRLVDINNDGLADVAAAAPGSHGVYTMVALGVGYGYFGSVAYQHLSGMNFLGHAAIFTDVNGDQMPDLVFAAPSASGFHLHTASSRGDGYFDAVQFQTIGAGTDFRAAIPRFGDANGDGHPDLFAIGAGSTGLFAHVALGTGAGYLSPIRWNVLSSADFSAHDVFISDLNGDDVSDLLLVARRSTGLWVQHVLGDGTGSFWPWTNSSSVASANYLNYHSHLADSTGDGLTDVVLLQTGPYGFHSVSMSSLASIIRLNKVTDSLGRESHIEYAPMTSAAVHTPDTGADRCAFPCVDASAPVPVVSRVNSDDGVGGQLVTTYRYGGSKVDLHGRGWLGFRWVEATDETTGTRERSHHHQHWPLIGQVESSERFVLDGAGQKTMLSTTSSTWQVTESHNGTVLFPHVSRQEALAYEFSHGPGNEPVTHSVTETSHDAFGNPVSVAQSTLAPSAPGEVFSTVTTSDYFNDAGSWLLGRLVCSRVVSSAPNTPSLTRVSGFEYDPVTGRVVREVIEPAAADITEPSGVTDCKTGLVLPSPNNITLTTVYGYDGFGNRTSSAVSGEGVETQIGTTLWGERDAVAPGTVIANGRFSIAGINALGHESQLGHDPATGQTVWTRDPNGVEVSSLLDGFGRVTTVSNPDGTVASTLRTRCGQGGSPACALAPPSAVSGLEQTTSGGGTSHRFHDALGREVRSASQSRDGRWVLTDTEYQASGQVARQSRPYFQADGPTHWTTMAYDAIGREQSVTAPDGTQTQRLNDGLELTEIDPQGRRVTRRKNVVGQLVEIRQDNAVGASPPELVTLHEVDARGELTRTIDPAGNVTTLSYDARGRKASLTDPDMGTWAYTHDAFGRLVHQIDARGQTISNAYDRLDRRVQRVDDDGNGGTSVTTWTYDTAANGLGKLHLSAGGGSGIVQDYDAIGRLIRTTQTIAAEPFTTELSYDNQGRLASTRYPTGLEVHNVYTATGHLEQVSDGNGEVWWTAIEANADGRIVSEAFGNGLSTTRDYTASTGRLERLRTGTIMDPFSVQDLSVAFDSLGNLVMREDHRANRRESFTYDALSRLVHNSLLDTATGQLVRPDEITTYDNLGNLTSRTGVGTYTYGQNGAGPHAVSSVGSTAYEYDANGNMIARAGDTIAWEVFNKPGTLTSATGVARFLHGAERQRIQQTVTSGGTTRTTKYVGSLYEKVTAANAPDEHIHYIHAGGRQVVLTTYSDATPSKTRYLHKDHLDSVVSVTDELGTPVEELAYDAWGLRRSAGTWLPATVPVMAAETSRGFTDHEHLDGLTLVHMNGRIYDPTIGRFLSADPHVQYLANSQSYNRYSYVLNNPLSYNDPSGYFLGKIFKAVTKPLKKLASSRIGRLVLGAGVGWLTSGATTAWLTGGHWTISSAVAANVQVGIGTIAAAGAASGFASTLVTTGDIKAAVRSAAFSAVSAGVANGVVQAVSGSDALSELAAATSGLSTDALHGLAQGALSEAFGGDFTSGFAGAFAGHAAGRFAKVHLEGTGIHLAAARTFVASVAGGLAATAAGGSFVHGAVSAALTHLFNTESTYEHDLKVREGDLARILADPVVQKALQAQMKRLLDLCQKGGTQGCGATYHFIAGPLTVDMKNGLLEEGSLLPTTMATAAGILVGRYMGAVTARFGEAGFIATTAAATAAASMTAYWLRPPPFEVGDLYFYTWSYIDSEYHSRLIEHRYEWLIIRRKEVH